MVSLYSCICPVNIYSLVLKFWLFHPKGHLACTFMHWREQIKQRFMLISDGYPYLVCLDLASAFWEGENLDMNIWQLANYDWLPQTLAFSLLIKNRSTASCGMLTDRQIPWTGKQFKQESTGRWMAKWTDTPKLYYVLAAWLLANARGLFISRQVRKSDRKIQF